MGRISNERKNKKKLLAALDNEQYRTIEWNGGHLLYDKKRETKYANWYYLGRFYINNSGDRYIFNDDEYDNIEKLVEAMDKHNAKLPFPSVVYDPTWRKNAQIEMALNIYLESLGFKNETLYEKGFETGLMLRDPYGRPIFNIEYETVIDTTCGKVKGITDSHHWVEVPFADMETAIGACNEILASYFGALNARALNVLNKLTESRVTSMLDVYIDMKHMRAYTTDGTKKAIEVLEKELRTLKGEE